MKFRLFALAAVLVTFALPAFADSRSAPWIAKARAALGSERALNAVQSIHFKGTLRTTQQVPSEGDATATREEPLVLGIEIVFQKPYQQQMTLRSDRVIETTTLDGYDAWVRRADATNESQWQLSLLDSQQVKRLRANTWENLFFYSGIESRGGQVQFGGEMSMDGRDCVKLTFSHSDNIVFTRFFDKSTGRLVKTETENGGEIREEGDIVVEGVRFPKTLINRSAGGTVATITFDSVTLNTRFSSDQFLVPTLLPSHR